MGASLPVKTRILTADVTPSLLTVARCVRPVQSAFFERIYAYLDVATDDAVGSRGAGEIQGGKTEKNGDRNEATESNL